MNKIFAPFLPPWVETGLQPAFYDMESGTVLQQTARMYAKVQQLTRLFNELSTETRNEVETFETSVNNRVTEFENSVNETVQDYIDRFVALKDFVDDYFDNLDVQEEINNKLDEMAEDGTLTEIISQFLGLGALVVVDTVADMISAENLTNGSRVKTLGKESFNDGYGAYYTIGETGDIALDNGLYATLVDDFGGDNYYNEITITTNRDYNTDYYVTNIPLNDSDGNIIQLSVNEDATNTPITYAEKNYTTITTNAGLTRQNSSSQWRQGAIISNGVALHEDLCDIAAPSYMSYIGFKEDRTILNFPASATTTTMLAQGVKNAFLTFGQLITNGVKTIPAEWDEEHAPRLNIGVKSDGTIIILACDGRTNRDTGLTMDESADVMLGLGVVNAWRCDGGGSTSLVWKGSKQNRNIEGDGTVDRDIHVTFNIKKETVDKELAKVYSYIGKERQLLNKQIRKDMSYIYKKKQAFCTFNNWSGGYNTVSENDQNINLQFQDFNSNDNKPLNAPDQRVFKIISNSNNKHIGFKMNETGLFEVSYTVNVLCANTAGIRRVSVTNTPAGAPVSNLHSHFDSYITPTASSQTYCFSGNIVINNSTAGTEYYFGAKGKAGDDFNRVYVTLRHIGTAGS